MSMFGIKRIERVVKFFGRSFCLLLWSVSFGVSSLGFCFGGAGVCGSDVAPGAGKVTLALTKRLLEARQKAAGRDDEIGNKNELAPFLV